MKEAQEIIAYLAMRIGHLYYHRPLMYGGTGAGVDLLLHTYHVIWSEITDRHDDFRQTWRNVLEEENCGSADFSSCYSMNHLAASEAEIAEYVVKQWRKVSDRLEVPIPHARLQKEFGR